MIQTRNNPEQQIAEPARAWVLRQPGVQGCMNERVVWLRGTTVKPDGIVYYCTETEDFYGVLECKRGLSDELIEQLENWIGVSNFIIGAVKSVGHANTRHKAMRAHVCKFAQLLYVDGEAVVPFNPSLITRGVDTGLLRQVYHAHSGEFDAPIGVQSAKRITAANASWEPLRKFLHGGPREWFEVQAHVREMRAITAAAARKAIDRGECVGVQYEGHARTMFYAEETK